MKQTVIGWKEYVDFPEWSLRCVKVKIDTGARTSALGVRHYELKTLPNGQQAVHLQIAPYRQKPERQISVEVPVVRFVRVRNSGGCSQVRPVVATKMKIGSQVLTVFLTVTYRPKMLHQILLGRNALGSMFLIDAGRKFMLKRSERSVES